MLLLLLILLLRWLLLLLLLLLLYTFRQMLPELRDGVRTSDEFSRGEAQQERMKEEGESFSTRLGLAPSHPGGLLTTPCGHGVLLHPLSQRMLHVIQSSPAMSRIG